MAGMEPTFEYSFFSDKMYFGMHFFKDSALKCPSLYKDVWLFAFNKTIFALKTFKKPKLLTITAQPRT